LGEKTWKSLTDIPLEVDVVDLFVRSEQTAPFIRDAIEIGAKAIWLQLDIYNESELAQARKVGIATAENRCTKIEHQLALVNKNKFGEI
jgi:predicted CoA-binding protein